MLIPCSIIFMLFVKSKDFDIKRATKSKYDKKSVNPNESMLS